jgi:hypothetical protein
MEVLFDSLDLARAGSLAPPKEWKGGPLRSAGADIYIYIVRDNTTITRQY